MISFEKALKLMEKNSRPLGTEIVDLSDALGRIIARDIQSPVSLPLFDNSAMDGFALSAENFGMLKVAGTVKAGDSRLVCLKDGETFRIMTGARMPQGADSVIPVEEAIIKNGFLLVEGFCKKGWHVRMSGEEIKKGERALSKFTMVHPGVVGFLATMGIDKVLVFEKPRVSLIATGSELIKPGQKLKAGKIYNSNSYMIAAALKNIGIEPVLTVTLKDSPEILKKHFSRALAKSDVLILTGGVSAGDYDFAKAILSKIGVRTVFWKVRQKPGKPVYFGKKGKKLVFGLPGNPASVFTCFYEYVYPCLRRIMGFSNPFLTNETLPLAQTVKADPGKTLFLKGKIGMNGRGKEAGALGHQASHMMSSLSQADCFILIPPREGFVQKGERITAHLLPFGGGNQ